MCMCVFVCMTCVWCCENTTAFCEDDGDDPIRAYRNAGERATVPHVVFLVISVRITLVVLMRVCVVSAMRWDQTRLCARSINHTRVVCPLSTCALLSRHGMKWMKPQMCREHQTEMWVYEVLTDAHLFYAQHHWSVNVWRSSLHGCVQDAVIRCLSHEDDQIYHDITPTYVEYEILFM